MNQELMFFIKTYKNNKLFKFHELKWKKSKKEIFNYLRNDFISEYNYIGMEIQSIELKIFDELVDINNLDDPIGDKLFFQIKLLSPENSEDPTTNFLVDEMKNWYPNIPLEIDENISIENIKKIRRNIIKKIRNILLLK